MPVVKKSIEVNAPLERVFELWTNFERFPEFMNNVKSVQRKGPDRTHWVTRAPGRDVQWDADTHIRENHVVEWDADGDSKQHGRVTFDDLGTNRTRINVRMDYHLHSKLQELGAKWFGIDGAMVENDLERFKDLVETGHTDVTDRHRQ